MIGSSGRACTAPKRKNENHCGVESRARRKAEVIEDAYYAPSGEVKGKPTFQTGTYVLASVVPEDLKREFNNSFYTSQEWIHRIINASIPLPVQDPKELDEESFEGSGDGSLMSYELSIVLVLEKVELKLLILKNMPEVSGERLLHW